MVMMEKQNRCSVNGDICNIYRLYFTTGGYYKYPSSFYCCIPPQSQN